MTDLDEKRFPVLHWLLFAQPPFGDKGERGNLAHVIPPGCSHCSFAKPDADDAPNIADPDEGSYHCALLGDEEVSRRNNDKKCWTYHLPTVWGESPLCEPRDWAAKARAELEAVLSEGARATT